MAIDYSVSSQERYTQASEFLQVPELQEVLELLKANYNSSKKVFVTCESELEPYIAGKILEYMDSTGIPSEEWSLYDMYLRQDLMCRGSFHVKRGHPVPKTGSRSTVGHHKVPLKGDRNWVVQYTIQGDTCSITSNWNGLFSYSGCMKIAEAIKDILPKNIVIKANTEEQEITLEVRFPEIGYKVGIVIKGQGKVSYIPESLERLCSGQCCLVKDTMYDTYRPGYRLEEGYFWQL